MSDSRIKEAYAHFKSKGYPDAAVAGMLGHLVNESGRGLNTRAIHDNGTGIGIAGWRDPQPGKGRKTDLFNFASARGADVYDFKTQLDFIDHELRTKEFGVYKRLMASKTPDEAALAFMSYERPRGWTPNNPAAGDNWKGRHASALQIFNTFSGLPPVQLADVTSTAAPDRAPRVSLNDTAPTEPFTMKEEREAAQKQSEGALGFFGSAVESGWDASPVKWAYHGLSEKMEPDPDFRWKDNEKLLKELTNGVPMEHWDAFQDATSEAHARKIRENIDSQLDLQRRIQAGGWSAFGGALLGEMLEPTGVAASFLAPEAALPLKAGRLGRIVVGGLAAAGTNAALELPRYAMKETASANDLLWAAGTGMALGGAFGALRRNPATQAEADAIERIGKGIRSDIQQELNGSTALSSGSSVGAAAYSSRQSLHPEMEAWFHSDLHAPETGVQGLVRFDSVGQLKSSPSPVARASGDQLGLDAVGNKDRSTATSFAATEYERRTHNGMMAQVSKEYTLARKEFFKEHDVKWADRDSYESRFRKEVTAFIRNTDPSREFSPAVARMGTKIRALHAQYVDLLRNPGKLSGRTLEPVPGFERLETNENYILRKPDGRKVTEKTVLFGDESVSDAISKAMMGKNPDIKPEVAQKMARGYLKRLRELAADVDMKGDRAASGQDADALREMLEEFGTLSPKEVDEVVEVFKPKEDGPRAVHDRAKHRALFDENFEVMLKVTDPRDPRFGQSVPFRVMDLFEDDAIALFELYSRQISGLLGLHQVRVKNPRFTMEHVRPMQRPGVEILESQTSPDIRSANGEVNMTVNGDHVVVNRFRVTTRSPDHARELLEAAADYAESRGKRLVSTDEIKDPLLIRAFQDLKGDWNVHFARSQMRTKHKKVQYARRDGKPVFEVYGKWTPPSREDEYLVKGLAKEAEWDKLFERLAQSWDELVGSGKVSHEQRIKGLELDRANLEFLRDQIMGRLDKVDQSRWGLIMRRLRDYNFLRLMNNVGLAQVTEFFFATSSVGFKAAFSAMPAFRSLVRSAKTGELDDVIARDIEYMTNYGTDWVRGSLRSTLDDNGVRLAGNRLDQLMEKGKRASTVISGMAAINTALQRFAARGVYAKFAYMADGDPVNWQRLAAMGIDKPMAERIFKMIRENRTYIEGASGKLDLPRMNLEKWSDKEAAAHFQMGVTRWAEYAVLLNDPGSMSRFVGTWFGKVIMQFRSFIMGAWGRHLLHNIHMRDWNTVFTFLFTGFGGVLTHIAHSHLATLGRSDRQEELEKRLSMTSLILNGWARTSYSSFMPMFVDSAVTMAGFDPVFTRVSGQHTDAFFGNPTIGLLNDTAKGISGIAANLADGNDVSQADVRNLAKMFPYQNWIPLQAILSTMISNIPEFDPRGKK